MKRTVLDALLDRVQRGIAEVTIDTDGYTDEQAARVVAAAQAKGLNVARDRRFILIRDLLEARS